MLNFKRALALLGAMVMALLGVVSINGTAAQAASGDCGAARFCIWTGYNYTGTRYEWANAAVSVGVSLNGHPANNKARSFKNNISGTTTPIRIYDNANCGRIQPPSPTAWSRTLSAGQIADAQGSDWGDKVSSFRFDNGGTC